MAKSLLSLFGGISILTGFLALAGGFFMGLNFLVMGWGVGMLIAGAPLLGFARAIELLERIAGNTQPPGRVDRNDGRSVDPMVAEYFRKAGREGDQPVRSVTHPPAAG